MVLKGVGQKRRRRQLVEHCYFHPGCREWRESRGSQVHLIDGRLTRLADFHKELKRWLSLVVVCQCVRDGWFPLEVVNSEHESPGRDIQVYLDLCTLTKVVWF